ncbi:MAG: chemotaxis protein CheX [Nitrospinae bacterium]|nr:chemotaxis protein CheX [Nitrospinota bacterium]MBI3813214.1 chemotaxis protein CheX [Nitrospinota bacterium]
MNVDYINPFLNATINVLETMAFIKPQQSRKPYLKKREDLTKGDVTGIIGLTGHERGSIAVSFSKKCILRIIKGMLGEEKCYIDTEVRDAAGELTNMIAGDGRRILSSMGYNFEASIPTIIVGPNHYIEHTTKGSIIVIPFKIEDNPFFVEACFEK